MTKYIAKMASMQLAHLPVGRVSGAPLAPPVVTLNPAGILIGFPRADRMVDAPFTPPVVAFDRWWRKYLGV